MIQRIQSVFLFLVAVCMIAMIFSTIWEKISVDEQEKVTLTALYLTHYTIDTNSNNPDYTILNEKPTYFIAALAVISAIISLYSIFQYKSRMTQLKFGLLNILLIAATLGLSIYYMYQGEALIKVAMGGVIRGTYKIGIFLPALALLFNSMANRFIKRDENLVRSADRIR
jgi:uncharacterized membrane-anchored protein